MSSNEYVVLPYSVERKRNSHDDMVLSRREVTAVV